MAAKYFGPYKILAKVGAVSYHLELPLNSNVHPIFHVSLLKKQVGPQVLVQSELPRVEVKPTQIHPLAQAILETRMQKGEKELLVHWQGLSPADATWEPLVDFQVRFPYFSLEDKES